MRRSWYGPFIAFVVIAMFVGGGHRAAAKSYEIAVVVKIAGIPWFNRLETGVLKAAKELGVNAYVVGPAEADPGQQAELVDHLIAKGIDALCVVPNDTATMEPLFQKAKANGMVVLTHEALDQQHADWNVETLIVKKDGGGEF